MSGYLEKQGGSNNNKGWRKRLITLEGNFLRYYKGENVLSPPSLPLFFSLSFLLSLINFYPIFLIDSFISLGIEFLKKELAGIIFVEDMTSVGIPKARFTTMTGKHRFVFEIATRVGRDYLFCATSLEEMDTWIEKINEAIDLRKVFFFFLSITIDFHTFLSYILTLSPF